MKILYIEDDYTVLAVNKMRYLFNRYLNDANTQLKDIIKQSEKDGYPPEPEEIQKIVNSSGILEYEYNFSEALKKIINRHEKYDLIIVDRNLYGTEDNPCYDYKEVLSLKIETPSFDFEKYKTREGDYILNYLFCETGKKVLDKFYFLTANDASSDILNTEHLRVYLDLNVIKENNFIKKAKDEDKFKTNVIDKLDSIQLRQENKKYLKILEEYISSTAADEFIEKIIIQKDSSTRTTECLWQIRVIFENILKQVFKRLEISEDDNFLWDKSHSKVIVTNFVNHLRKKKLIQNSILENFFKNFYSICSSEYATHRDYTKLSPSTDVVNSMVYQLKEIIIWFGNLCETLKK